MQDFSALLGETVTGAIRPSKGKYKDRVFEGRMTCPLWEFNLGMAGFPCPMDLYPWAFYSLPVLGKTG